MSSWPIEDDFAINDYSATIIHIDTSPDLENSVYTLEQMMATLVEPAETRSRRTQKQEASRLFDIFAKIPPIPKKHPILARLKPKNEASTTSSSIQFRLGTTAKRDRQANDTCTGSFFAAREDQRADITFDEVRTRRTTTSAPLSASVQISNDDYAAAISGVATSLHHTDPTTLQGDGPQRYQSDGPNRNGVDNPQLQESPSILPNGTETPELRLSKPPFTGVPDITRTTPKPLLRRKLQGPIEQVSEDAILPLEPIQSAVEASDQSIGPKLPEQPMNLVQRKLDEPTHETKPLEISLGRSTLFRLQKTAYVSPHLPLGQDIVDIWENELRGRLDIEIQRTGRSPQPDMSIVTHCMMAGKSESQLSPHIVTYCNKPALCKKLAKEVRKFDWIPKSGLRCMITPRPVPRLSNLSAGAVAGIIIGVFSAIVVFIGALFQILRLRRKDLGLAASRSSRASDTSENEKALDGGKATSTPTFCGIPFKLTTDTDQTPPCTLGGLITVGDNAMGITVAHGIIESSKPHIKLKKHHEHEPHEAKMVEPIFIQFDSDPSTSSSGSIAANGVDTIDGNDDNFRHGISTEELPSVRLHECTGTLDRYSHVGILICRSTNRILKVYGLGNGAAQLSRSHAAKLGQHFGFQPMYSDRCIRGRFE